MTFNFFKYLTEKYPDRKWDWKSIFENPRVDPHEWLQDKKFNTLASVYKHMSTNPKLTIDTIDAHVKSNGTNVWDWYQISRHPNITPEIIESRPSYPWDKETFARLNRNVTLDFILSNGLDETCYHVGDIICVHAPLNVIEYFVERQEIYTISPGDWIAISNNKNLTVEFMNKYFKEIPDYYYILSHNENITEDFVIRILNERRLPFVFSRLSANPTITWDIICKYRDRQWDWYFLSMNKAMTLDIIEANLNEPWNWGVIMYNPNITRDFVSKYSNRIIETGMFHRMQIIEPFEQNLQDEKSWPYLSSNPYLTIDQIERYNSHVEFGVLSLNTLKNSRITFRTELYRYYSKDIRECILVLLVIQNDLVEDLVSEIIGNIGNINV